MRPRLALCAVLLALTACDRKPEPPAPVVAPAPAPAPAPLPASPEVTPADAGAPPANAPVGDTRCPPGQFFVHGGCHTGDDVGIAGPRR